MSDPVEEAAKLPLGQRLEHSHWRVRSNAYEELAKKYNEALENTSSIYHEYSGYFKKMMNDKNAAAMEKGLEPIYAFYDRYEHAAKFTASLAPLIIEKCLGARQGTKQRATELLMLMVEVDTTAEPVVIALVEGANNKVPKIAIAAIQTLELIVKTFGVKVVPLKPILATFLSWFDHTNAEARAAAQTFTIELYRWVGGVILDKPVANLRQAQVTELQKAFADIVKGAATPEKYLRCQMDQMQAAAAAGSSAAPAVEEVDLYSMVEAVNLMSKITPEMYEALQSKKWKDKKEALEAINKIADTPRLQSGEYTELVKNLKRLLGDANVFVVEESVKCLGFCAQGLRAEFAHFAKSTMGALLDKLKEKKDKVIAALQGTFDAYHPNCFAMADVMEDIVTASKHKVPQVKRELLNWVKRALPKEKRPLLTKNLKAWCVLFMELMDDSDSPVRENAFECFGLLIGIMGERSLTGYLNQLDKVKEKRVREFIPTTPIPAPSSGGGSAPSGAPVSTIDVNAGVNLAAAAAKKTAAPAAAKKASNIAAPVARSSVAAAPSKKTLAAPSATAKASSSASAPSATAAAPKSTAVEVFNPEPRVSAADAEARTSDFIPENLVAQLGDKDWKQRLDAMSVIASMVERWDEGAAVQNAESLLLFLVVARPSFKEPNVQVLAKMTEVLKRLCTVPINWNKNDVYVALVGIVERIHEAKLTNVCVDFLNACGENTNLGIQFVFNAMYGALKDQKAVKVVSESLSYLTTALSEFGGSLIEMRHLVAFVKTVALENTNATIKATGIRLLCECYKQMGGTALLALLADVKPQLLTTIKKEFEKVASERAAVPSRGPNGPAPVQGFVASSSPSVSASADLPRVDISAQITAAIPGFTNTDWQKRQEAMAGLESILLEVRRIQPKGLSALMAPLKARLADSNINLIPVALNLLGELASASGPTIESHIKTVMPSILGCYSNAKAPVRAACSTCLDKWVEEVGLDPILAYLPTALGTPSGRAELLGWISTKLAYVKKGDVKVLLKPSFQCYQDKTKEVRTVAETTIIELARRLTAKVVEGECSKLAPAILVQVRTLLKNNEAELKRPPPSAIPAPAARSKIPIPASLKMAEAAPSSSDLPSPIANHEPEESPLEASSAPVEVPSGPLLRNNKKADRELAMNDLPWLFDSSSVPTKLVDTLREQMVACANPDLLDRLFSTESKAHSSAIADLEASVDSSKDAVLESLDVILKWCSWRLFHSNTAIVKRIVALLEHLIGTLDIWDHKMSELEAVSFIPIVVVRLPHLSESLQSSLRSVLQSIETNLYAPSKIFKLFMQLQRVWTGSQLSHASKVECLRYLGAFIRRQSLSVCDPSEAFKVVSGLLGSDSDPSVSVAALQFFVEAAKDLQQDETLWQHISVEHHELIRSYLASPTTDTLAKYNLAPQAPVSTPNSASTALTVPASAVAPATVSAPAPKEEPEKPKPQPVLEKVQISKSAQFTLDLGKLAVEPLPMPEIALPSGIAASLLPSHITADPTPFLPSRQVSRTSVDAQAQAQRQSQLMNTVQSWIATLKSSDVSQRLDTLQQIFHGFSNDFRAFIFHIDPLLNTLIGQIKFYFDIMSAPVDQSANSMRTALLAAVGVIFIDENSAQHVPEALLKSVLQALLDALLGVQSLQIAHEDVKILTQTTNTHIVNVLNNANRTATWLALLSLLRERTTKDPATGAIAPGTQSLDVMRKCLVRITKPLSANLQKITVSAVLYEIHLFFVAHPPHLWPRMADSVLEAVKAALEKFVEVLGGSITNYMGSIPHLLPPPAINFYIKTFLLKYAPNMDPAALQSIATHDVNPETQPATLTELAESNSELLATVSPKVNTPTPEYRLPSPATDGNKQQALRHVFQKISKKETTQQGLVDLYWLQKDHPDLDVQKFLQPTSPPFKAFIADQLKRIAALDVVTSSSPSELEYVPKETVQNALQPAQDANAQLNRLRSLQSKLKLGKPSDGIVAVELDPSVLSSMAFTGSVVGTSTSTIAGGQSNLASLGGTASVSGFRERLRKATSSTEPLNSKFELPSLSMPVNNASTASAAPSSYALPVISNSDTAEIGVSAARPTTASTIAPVTSAAVSHIPVAPVASSTSSGTSSVDALRERLAKIKAKPNPATAQ
jgi:cytoskeleton-associated protein 5